MDLEKGFARFESVPWPSRPPDPLKSSCRDQCTIGANASNLGKVTRYVAHGDDCSCIPCRRALIREQRSMEPLTRTDKFHILGVVCASISILALFALAWMAS